MKLDFNKQTENYAIIYEALCATDYPFVGGQVRTVSRLFTKLESVGKPKANHLFELNSDHPIVELEEPEFELLLAAFNNVKWNALGARKAAGAYEFLISASQRTGGE